MTTEAIRSEWVGRAIDGRFTLLEWLGGSEQSGVFLTELEGDRPQKAAIRLDLADAAEVEAQRSRWARTTDLSHPHLMRLFFTGSCEIDGVRLLYAVTEYADENLSQILPERPLTPAEAREMLGPVLDALGYLHGSGFVHGDIQPSKIMVVGDQVKLPSDDLHVTGELVKRGKTLEVYDAPEAGAEAISPAADIWSLGVTVVEALTQHPPVWDRSAQSEPIVPGSIPEPLAGIARESLRLDPARRCTLGEIEDCLETGRVLLNPPSTASAGNTGSLASARFLKPALAVATLVLIAVLAVVVVRSHRTQSLPSTKAQQPELAIGAAPTQPPTRKNQRSKGAAQKGAVAERVMPEVLPKARASIHGQFHVKVRVAVGASGNVTNASFESPGPSKYFAKVALDAAQHWRFKPAEVKGQAVASVWILQFRFTRSGTEVTPVQVSP